MRCQEEKVFLEQKWLEWNDNLRSRSPNLTILLIILTLILSVHNKRLKTYFPGNKNRLIYLKHQLREKKMSSHTQVLLITKPHSPLSATRQSPPSSSPSHLHCFWEKNLPARLSCKSRPSVLRSQFSSS